MNKLKPCPFCGCQEAGAQWHHGYWSVTCGYAHDSTPSKHCFQDWGEFETEKEAVEAWNNRHENATGEWISTLIKAKKTCLEDKFDRYQPITCSICKNPAYEKYNYCPSCGAKMNNE